MRTQSKIALIFFIFSLSVVIFLSGSIYYVTSQYTFDDFYKRLEIRAVVNARMLDSTNVQSSVLKEVRQIHLEPLPNEKEYFYELVNGQITESAIPELPRTFFQEIVTNGKSTFRIGETFYSGLHHKGDNREYIVVVSADSYYNTHHLRYLRNVFIIGILITAVLSLIISVIFSRMVFNPVKEITRRAKEIGIKNLSLRLHHRGSTMRSQNLQKRSTTC